MDIEAQLRAHLDGFDQCPFLFVGSGLSRRYIELEDWEGVLRRFATGLARPYEYYKTLADRKFPQIATHLAEAWFEKWWHDEAFADRREKIGGRLHNKESCLKFEIAQYIGARKYSGNIDETLAAEVNLLRRAVVDGLITTNWDTFLEEMFPDFKVYVGQDAILTSPSQGIGETYKIHGCVSNPNSIVLTADDYQDFNKRNPYLAAKLLTIFIERPVIFVGYSLNDPNVTEILRQIATCLTENNLETLRDRLIFIQRDRAEKGEIFEASTVGIGELRIPVTIVRTNDFARIFRPLGQLRRRFPARLLRRMKEHIYSLVKTNDPKSQLAVVDIEDADRFDELEVVFGLGVHGKMGEIGYSAITRQNLFDDVLADRSKYEPRQIVEKVLPRLLRSTPYVPVFRYLSEGGYLGQGGLIDGGSVDGRIRLASEAKLDVFRPASSYVKRWAGKGGECRSVEDVVASFGSAACYLIPLLTAETIDTKSLLAYIETFQKERKGTGGTCLGKLICLYDMLKYRQAFEGG